VAGKEGQGLGVAEVTVGMDLEEVGWVKEEAAMEMGEEGKEAWVGKVAAEKVVVGKEGQGLGGAEGTVGGDLEGVSWATVEAAMEMEMGDSEAAGKLD